MSDQKISELTNITGANLANADEFVVVDVSADQTKAVTREEFFKNTPNITVDGDVIIGDDLFVSGPNPVINIVETGVNQHRIVGTGGILYIQAQDSDGTTDGDIHLTGYNNNDLGLLRIKAANTTITGDLGIGTSSPSAPLQVVSTSGAIPALGAASSHAAIGSGGFGTMIGTRSTGVGYIQQQRFDGTATAYDLLLQPNGGNVGIGTTSPSERLEIRETGISNPAVIRLVGTNSAGSASCVSAIGSQQGAGGTGTGDLTFSTRGVGGSFSAPAEAMRIDSSGNVLVGKTAINTAVVGGELRASGLGAFVRDGGEPLFLNRLTSDGNIAVFRKDGTTVGSIGTAGSTIYLGSDDTNIIFDSGATPKVGPAGTAGAASNGIIDLGDSGSRFKDLYLSGGVYLGGTVAANKLDDYEEGTWTPVFSDATSGGNAATANGGKRGLYTKIGNQVTVSCSAINLDTTGMTGANDLRIQGLPFTPTSYASPNHYWTGGTRLGAVSFNTNGFVTAYVSDAITYVRLGETISGSSIDNIICSELTSGSADIAFTMTYETT